VRCRASGWLWRSVCRPRTMPSSASSSAAKGEAIACNLRPCTSFPQSDPLRTRSRLPRHRHRECPVAVRLVERSFAHADERALGPPARGGRARRQEEAVGRRKGLAGFCMSSTPVSVGRPCKAALPRGIISPGACQRRRRGGEDRGRGEHVPGDPCRPALGTRRGRPVRRRPGRRPEHRRGRPAGMGGRGGAAHGRAGHRASQGPQAPSRPVLPPEGAGPRSSAGLLPSPAWRRPPCVGQRAPLGAPGSPATGGVAWALRNEPPVELPQAVISADPEATALDVRRWLGVEVSARWNSDHAALAAWRSALDGRGVLALNLPIGKGEVRAASRPGTSALPSSLSTPAGCPRRLASTRSATNSGT
jgi:hypothetical protein